MRYDFEESVVAGYNKDARTEVNQSFEYVGKSVPLLKRYPCERLSSITSTHPLYPVPPVERLHFSFKRTVLKLCFSLGNLSLASDALRIDLCQNVKFLPAPIAHGAAPISVASSPRSLICDCSESYSRGLGHW